MGLTIDNEPDLFSFAKNNIIIAGKVLSTDLIITQRDNASYMYVITTAQGGMPNGAWIEFLFPNYNFSGIAKTIRFNIKDAPSGIFEIKSFAAYGKPLKEWVNFLMQSIFKVPYFADNYIASINTSFAGQVAFSITAKNKGTVWNFNCSISSPFFQPGNQNSIASTGDDVIDNLFIACHIYRKTDMQGVDVNIISTEKIASYKAFLDKDYNFNFSINTDIVKKLQSYLYKNNDTKHLGTEQFKYVIELQNRNNPFTFNVNQNLLADFIHTGEFTALLAGRAFYQSIGKDINLDYFKNENRLFLTNRPKICYYGDTIFINDFILNNTLDATNIIYATVQFNYENGTSEIIDIPNVVKLDNKIACINFNFNNRFFADLFLEKFPVSIKYQIKNLDANNNNLTSFFSETREIIFNRKPFRTENYFRFYGSLGNSDFAWLNGKIEMEVEAEGIEYENDLAHIKTSYGDEATIWKSFQFGKDDVKYNQKFKINTGYKSKEEIQWLQELIGSELIFWYTKNQMKALVDYTNGLDHIEDDLYYQVVFIDKNSINFHDSDNELQAMSFEFKIAVQSAAPHYILNNKLAPIDIDKDTFVIDVTQAPIYNSNENPTVAIKVLDNYQIGQTLIIEGAGFTTIDAIIVDENENNVMIDSNSTNIAYSNNINQIAYQIKLLLDNSALSQLNPQNTNNIVTIDERNSNLIYYAAIKITSVFCTKEIINASLFWKYILQPNPLLQIDGFTFANGTNKIFLHEILTPNQNGTDTFYNFKFPNDLESWIYCIADYFSTNPQLSLFETEIDNRGYIKIKYKAGGGLANSNALMRGLLDKYIFVTKLQD